MENKMEQPTIEVYNGKEYIIKYDFEHMNYTLRSKLDDYFAVSTHHYHKIIAWLKTYGKLTDEQIDEISLGVGRSFLASIK
jgi:hypothetical protein